MKASIVVLTKNSWALTARFINSVMTYAKDIDEIIFVDNGSTDKTLEELEKFKNGNPNRIKLIKLSVASFAKLCNTGIEAARNQYVILSNNDVELVNNFSITNLIESITFDPSLAIVASTTDNCGQPLQWFHDGNNCKPVVIESPDVNFIFVLIDKNFWNNRKMDEHYYFGVEDIDYCFEAKAAGRKVGVCLASFVHHVGSATSKIEFSQKEWENSVKKGWDYFVSKWGEVGRKRFEEKK